MEYHDFLRNELCAQCCTSRKANYVKLQEKHERFGSHGRKENVIKLLEANSIWRTINEITELTHVPRTTLESRTGVGRKKKKKI